MRSIRLFIPFLLLSFYIYLGNYSLNSSKSNLYLIFRPLIWVNNGLDAIVSNLNFFILMEGNYTIDKKRIKDLEIEVNSLRESNNKLIDSLKKHVSLRYFSNVLKNIYFLKDFVSANVVYKSCGVLYTSIIIDRGYNDGLENNMPVISFFSGESTNKSNFKMIVVGKVVDVQRYHSRVAPITDLDSNIYVKVIDNNVDYKLLYSGFIRGQGAIYKDLILTQLQQTIKTVPNSEVVTSGGQSIFPANITVGRVVRDISRSDDFKRHIIVKPYVDYMSLAEVFVLKTKQPKSLKKIMEAFK